MIKIFLIILLTFLTSTNIFSQTKKKKTISKSQTTTSYSSQKNLIKQFRKYQFMENGVAADSKNLYTKIIIPYGDETLITFFIGNNKKTMKRISGWENNCENCGIKEGDLQKWCYVIYGNERVKLILHIEEEDGANDGSISLIDGDGVHSFGNW